MDNFGGGQPDGPEFDMSQVTNTPPQIFGSADGSSVPPTHPGNAFFDEQMMGGMEDANDAKRRRIARVCLLCWALYSFCLSF